MKNCQSCTNKVRNSYTYCYECNSKRNDNLSSSFASNTIYKKTPIPKTVRNCLWINYFKNKREDKCQCCLRETISISNFHAGHIISEFKGGTTPYGGTRLGSCALSVYGTYTNTGGVYYSNLNGQGLVLWSQVGNAPVGVQSSANYNYATSVNSSYQFEAMIPII